MFVFCSAATKSLLGGYITRRVVIVSRASTAGRRRGKQRFLTKTNCAFPSRFFPWLVTTYFGASLWAAVSLFVCL